jgi:hypothetical protein
MPRSAWLSASTRSVAYLRVFFDGDARQARPAVGQIGIVDLQQEAGVDDRAIFLTHRFGNGEDEFLVVLVIVVGDPVLDCARRICRKISTGRWSIRERRLEIVDVVLQIGVADITQRLDANRHGWRPQRLSARNSREIIGKFLLVPCDHAEPATPALGRAS